MDWRDDAACKNRDPDLFFPVGTTGPAILQTELAKRICYSCPVEEICLAWALETNQAHGVWGGMDETQRQAIQRRGIGRRATVTA
jgi:WhiB family transcriptional regulator, redox-sensing transcriptional regulator